VDERTSVDPDIPPRADGMAVTFDHVREDATHPAVLTLIDLVGSDLAALHKLKRAAIELHNAIHLLDMESDSDPENFPPLSNTVEDYVECCNECPCGIFRATPEQFLCYHPKWGDIRTEGPFSRKTEERYRG